MKSGGVDYIWSQIEGSSHFLKFKVWGIFVVLSILQLSYFRLSLMIKYFLNLKRKFKFTKFIEYNFKMDL